GGHSLLAVRLISAIRKELSAELPISEIFDYPTVGLLAKQLAANTVNSSSVTTIVAITPRPARIPLSFSQQRLWFIDCLGGSVQYNVPAVLRLKGQLNKEAIAYVLQNVVNRHEVLRTVFMEEGGEAYQYIKEREKLQITFVDGLQYKGDSDALRLYIEKLIRAPFDLSKDTMLRAALIMLDEKEHVLVVTLHHIASDAWSTPIIVKEIIELYSAFEAGRPAELPLLPIQYADYAIWQRNYLQGDVLDKKISYWKEKLDGVAQLELPTDYIRPVVQTMSGALVVCKVDREVAHQLQELSTREGCSLFMTLLAAFKVLLNRYSGQQDICVGTSIANRNGKELEGLVGFLVNTLALRDEVISDSPFNQLLQQVRATTMGAYEHQDVPFEKVVETVVKERDSARSALFQVMLVLLNTPPATRLGLGELELSFEGFETKLSKFEITFFVSQSGNGLNISIVYNTDLFREDTINRMAGHYKQLLSSIVKEPMQSIDLLQMLTEEEEQQLLAEFN
ncbi:MAG: condensation domain-containing protein, partial [Ferruginibacter sp.]